MYQVNTLSAWNEARKKKTKIQPGAIGCMRVIPQVTDYSKYVSHIYMAGILNRDAFINALAEKYIRLGIPLSGAYTISKL